ncbi:hypothetical protein HanXRQr2_Chr11g0501361 [Helianthus annuus]|uniref:Uncharacterized protein n=1 Tax=Helianthus annuus TaxID=4232 RepID=A0A9K3N1A9_HELAN|nr:hypothetical protein HanXRQr2_Chr11g0501361 [Helianthus annuus]KAJ0875983.1 hypothetical protein HanPSC8_Chr11g0483161 [Helianthus annuus]
MIQCCVLLIDLPVEQFHHYPARNASFVGPYDPLAKVFPRRLHRLQRLYPAHKRSSNYKYQIAQKMLKLMI